jgi:hypothetical protein
MINLTLVRFYHCLLEVESGDGFIASLSSTLLEF